MDKIGGFLEVGLNESTEVVINHPDLRPDKDGVGHIVLSASQARGLAALLLKNAVQSENDERERLEAERRKAAEAVPVDRDCRTLTDGSAVTEDHREINPITGQQKGYVVLCETERNKGFVRPVRQSYRHVGKLTEIVNDANETAGHVRLGGCGGVTSMGLSIAETYARDPKFYSGTFCCQCCSHRPLEEFVWEGTDQQVGS